MRWLPRTEESDNERLRDRVRSLTVDRCMSETNYEHEVGEILTVAVEVKRSSIRRGSSTTINRTFRYRVRESIADVKSVEPTFPDRRHESGRINVHHIAPMAVEAENAVCEAVPEVEAVRALNGTLRNERAKHTDSYDEELTWYAEDAGTARDAGGVSEA